MLDLPQPSDRYNLPRERVRNERIRREFDKVVYKDELPTLLPESGDVVGPAVSVVDRIATYADTTGKLIKDSGVLITDLAPKASPVFTGNPTAPTPSPGDNDTSIATTGFVKAAIDVILGGVSSAFDTLSEIATELALKATLASPTFTGDPKAPTPAPGDNDTSIATSAFVAAAIAAGLVSPTFTGDPKAPTAAPGDNDVSIATTAFVAAAITAALAGASGVPTGAMVSYAAAAAPSGWLLCDGAAVSRTGANAALFALIGTTHGVGDGSTTFNVPDRRGRVGVGLGTGSISETRAAADFNVSDVITVASNPVGKVKWVTGMVVQVTTSGSLPTGISAATNYFVRRLSATTISLYTSLAAAMETNVVTGRVNITATGSGNHTMTCVLSAQALGDLFGVEFNGDVASHRHLNVLTGAGAYGAGGGTSGQQWATGAPTAAGLFQVGITNALIGQTEGVANMPPSIVVNYIIKT